MPQILCDKLRVGYESKTIASEINFQVESGDYLCIIGENGCGKTTLMKTILGLQPALDGCLRFGDGLRPNEIGYLPQQTDIQRDFPASVWEIVLSGCLNRMKLRPFYTAAEKKLATENMNKFGITALKNRCYRELSGGQQQRVLLARALCATRKMLLLDEPTAGLDPATTAELYVLLSRLCREDGVSIVMISHDVATSLPKASHVLHMGPPHFFGPLHQYTAMYPQ